MFPRATRSKLRRALVSLPRPRPSWAGVEPREVGEAARDEFWDLDPLNKALERQTNRPIGLGVISNALSIVKTQHYRIA